MTRDDFIRSAEESCMTAQELAQLFPGCFHADGRPRIAEARLPTCQGSLDYCPEARNPWRDAVTDALVAGGIYSAEHDANPRKAVADLIAWEIEIALDPAVSERAAALVAAGRDGAT